MTTITTFSIVLMLMRSIIAITNSIVITIAIILSNIMAI